MKSEGSLWLRAPARMLLALVPALLMAAYAARPAMAFLPYFALVPWIVLYTDPRRPRVSVGYYFVAAYVGWVMLMPAFFNFGLFPPFAMGAVFFVFWLPFAPLLRRIHHRFRLPRTLTVPLTWVTVEWLRATFTLAHFDLFLLGYSQARFPLLIQISDVLGVYGLSFLVAAVNGLLADLYFEWRDHAGWSVSRIAKSPRLLASAAAVAVGFVLFSAYGWYRLATAQRTAGPRLAVVQPNEPHSLASTLGAHLSQLVLTDRGVEPAAADLVVWPENAILDYLGREGAYLDDLGWLTDRKQAPILLGAMGRHPQHPASVTNTAFLVDRHGAIQGRYDKQLLFPWSEYVPFDATLAGVAPPLQRLHRSVARLGWGHLANGQAGDGMRLFELGWQEGELPFAVLICIENTYPPIPAEASRLGARFYINITSEGLVGGPIQEQLLRICILRAVENRMPYVRAGNTGISGFIDAQGRVRSVLRGRRGGTIDDAGVLVDQIWLSPPGVTLYAASRDAFVKTSVAATLILLAWSFLQPRRRPDSHPAQA